MDVNKEFDNFLSSMKNFNINVPSEFLSHTSYNIKYAGEVIDLLGKGLTNSNFKNRPDYFIFCEEQLLKIANDEEYQGVIFEFLNIINIDDCKLLSSVLIVVTVLEKTENPNVSSLEYLLVSTFNKLYEMDISNLKEILPSIIQLLIKLKKHFQLQQSVLYYFARVAFLVLQSNFEPMEYLNLLSNIIHDPYYLLEFDFVEKEEELYMASFFYLYFKTEMQWGPKIYNRFYILEKCCNLAMSVYDNNDFGKSFAKLILLKFKNNEIPLHLLNENYQNFVIESAHSSVYNENLNVRKESLESLIIFMDKLCDEAQYLVYEYVFSKPLELCIKEQLIIKMKNLIILNLKSNNLGYFQGKGLLKIVQLYCNFPNEPVFYVEINNKEHILTAISLMYFLSVNYEKLNLGEEFLIKTKQFVDTIQNGINNSYELHYFEVKNLDDNVVEVENRVEGVYFNFPKLSKSEKRTMLSQMNTIITLVQSNLNMLKSIMKG